MAKEKTLKRRASTAESRLRRLEEEVKELRDENRRLRDEVERLKAKKALEEQRPNPYTPWQPTEDPWATPVRPRIWFGNKVGNQIL